MQSIPESELERIGSAFDAYDLNASGTIDRNEFAQLVKTLGYALPEYQLIEDFNFLDANSNDTIDRQEFINWWCVNETAVMTKTGMQVCQLRQQLSKQHVRCRIVTFLHSTNIAQP
jgi:hypothetical protein